MVVRGKCQYIDNLIVCPQLDDRLGAWVCMDVLPRFGITCDVLLTTDEERGASTAKTFKPPKGKQYNWIFSFDRAGTDAVTYQYDDDDWEKALRNSGFKVGHGSYSCIASAEHLGVCGVNVGVAYYENHTKHSFALVDRLWSQIECFKTFYDTHRDTRFKFERWTAGRSVTDWLRKGTSARITDTSKSVPKVNGTKLDGVDAYCKTCGMIEYWCDCGTAEEYDYDFEPFCPKCGGEEIEECGSVLECEECGEIFEEADMYTTEIQPDNPDPDAFAPLSVSKTKH